MVSRAGSFLNLLARCLGVSHVVWFDFFQRYDCLSVAIFLILPTLHWHYHCVFWCCSVVTRPVRMLFRVFGIIYRALMLQRLVFINVMPIASCAFLMVINCTACRCHCSMMILNVGASRAFIFLMFCSCASHSDVRVLILFEIRCSRPRLDSIYFYDDKKAWFFIMKLY